MCCNPGHYPTEAGIFRTDIFGRHQHYGDVVTLPGRDTGDPRKVLVADEWEEWADSHNCTNERDHWHANMPLMLTACVENAGAKNFSIRAHDWFRHVRERSMGIDRSGTMYGGWGGTLEAGAFGVGYDLIGLFLATTPEQRDEMREQVIMALAEGVEISDEGLRRVIARFEGSQLKMITTGLVARKYVPDLEEWRRGNPFVKPSPSDNDLLYSSDMDGYTMANHGASASGLWLAEGGSFETYEDPDKAMLEQRAWAPRSMTEFVKEAGGTKKQLYQPTAADLQRARELAAARQNRRREPVKQTDLFNLGI